MEQGQQVHTCIGIDPAEHFSQWAKMDQNELKEKFKNGDPGFMKIFFEALLEWSNYYYCTDIVKPIQVARNALYLHGLYIPKEGDETDFFSLYQDSKVDGVLADFMQKLTSCEFNQIRIAFNTDNKDFNVRLDDLFINNSDCLQAKLALHHVGQDIEMLNNIGRLRDVVEKIEQYFTDPYKGWRCRFEAYSKNIVYIDDDLKKQKKVNCSGFEYLRNLFFSR